MVNNQPKKGGKGGQSGAKDTLREFIGRNDIQPADDPGFHGRLVEVIDAYDSRGQAGEIGGVGANQIGRYVRKISSPEFETVARLAAGKGFSLDWVWHGMGPKLVGGEAVAEPDPSTVLIPILDIRAGAGSEQWAGDERPISSLALPRVFLLFNRVKPDHAKLMFCIGTSMEPTIKDGAPMIVDTSDRGARDDVYVMRRGNGITVKRLQHLADGTVLLKSDNPAWEPDKLPKDEADELSVIGRVALVLQSI